MKTLLILVMLSSSIAEAYSQKDYKRDHAVCSAKANKSKAKNRLVFMADCIARLATKEVK